MSKAALAVYEAIGREGTQKSVLGTMQTREELYAVLGYHDFERKLDELFARDAGRQSVEKAKTKSAPRKRRS
jgi:methylisocitrate lyase